MKQLTKTAAMLFVLSLSANAFSADKGLLIDNFDSASQTNIGMERIYIDDKTAGGNSITKTTIADGVITLKGDIVPPRGQPGWSSMVLPLSALGETHDASDFSGVRLTVKIISGSLSLSANSKEVTNYDYHASPIMVPADGKFHQIDIPFTQMKRMWSQQTALNTETLNSISVVAFGLKKSTFNFSVSDVSFY